MAFAVSIALPPPSPSTKSHPSSRASVAPSVTVARIGFGCARSNSTAEIPFSASRPVTRSRIPVRRIAPPEVVTTSARLPGSCTRASSASRPAPNKIRAGIKKSNCCIFSPPLLGRAVAARPSKRMPVPSPGTSQQLHRLPSACVRSGSHAAKTPLKYLFRTGSPGGASPLRGIPRPPAAHPL